MEVAEISAENVSRITEFFCCISHTLIISDPDV